MMRRARSRNAGISLLELSAIIAIIGILAAILLPALARARETARRASCARNLSQLGMCFRMYADENGGRLPWSGGHNNAECLISAMTDYIEDVGLFTCPSDAEHQAANRASSRGEQIVGITNAAIDRENSCRMSYDYFGAYTLEPITLPPPQYGIPKIPVMWDHLIRGGSNPAAFSSPIFNHVPGGGNVLWLDGSVQFIQIYDWQDNGLPYTPEGIAFETPQAFAHTIRPEDVLAMPPPLPAPPQTSPPSAPRAAPAPATQVPGRQ